MLVHMGAMAANFDSEFDYVQAIYDSIVGHGHSLALDWIKPTRTRLNKGEVKNEELNWPKIVQDHLNAISRSDAIIMEASGYSFHHGFQSAYALLKQKPLLFLYREGSEQKSLSGLFASGISNDCFTIRVYRDKTDLKDIVCCFLRERDKSMAEVSLQLDTDTLGYIQARAAINGVRKSDVIAELVSQDIHRGHIEVSR